MTEGVFIPTELKVIAESLERGEQSPIITVRELLGYFKAQRRGVYVVEAILDALNSLQLTTEPDFQNIWIDAEIEIRRVPTIDTNTDDADKDATNDTGRTSSWEGTTIPEGDREARDPTFRIGALNAANQPVVSVKPDDPLSVAITKMLANDYSQLPVMTTPYEVKGIVSLSSIGMGIMLNNKGAAVRHQMEKASIVDAEEPLLDALPIIVEREYVLVRGGDRRITGIVTAADVSREFRDRAEPFLLLSEIEQHLRNLLSGRLSLEELQAVKNQADTRREVRGTADLTFGEYVVIFQNPVYWERLNLYGIQREEFIEPLARIRDIRNDVMHINPDPLERSDLEALRKFAKFLQKLHTIRMSR
jgi:predicted transcriptional regulator